MCDGQRVSLEDRDTNRITNSKRRRSRPRRSRGGEGSERRTARRARSAETRAGVRADDRRGTGSQGGHADVRAHARSKVLAFTPSASCPDVMRRRNRKAKQRFRTARDAKRAPGCRNGTSSPTLRRARQNRFSFLRAARALARSARLASLASSASRAASTAPRASRSAFDARRRVSDAARFSAAADANAFAARSAVSRARSVSSRTTIACACNSGCGSATHSARGCLFSITCQGNAILSKGSW